MYMSTQKRILKNNPSIIVFLFFDSTHFLFYPEKFGPLLRCGIFEGPCLSRISGVKNSGYATLIGKTGIWE
jgi:hypothetical protein